jgi:hypothetical protein
MFVSKKPKAVVFLKESEAILDVFTRTKEQLEILNGEIADEEASLEDKISELKLQQQLLADTKSKNEKVVSNIDKILA